MTWARPAGPARSRIAYAAAHVVADPLGDNTPGSPAVVDWEATLRFRRHLWSYGLRVADAMDTAQRNMGLDWAATRELIQRSADEAKEFGDPATLVACGAGTDHAPQARTLDEIVAAYTEQIETVRDAGAGVVVMASRQLAALARGPEDYHRVYGRLLAQTDRPVILHWLGEMFDPRLAGYWGSGNVAEATASFLALIREHAPMVDGVKVSLLDADHEIALRAALPKGVRLYTGDDFNYPSLIKSGSHALLGIFDAIAPAAAAGLQALDEGDFDAIRRDHGPDGPALPEDLRDAHLQLQDRHRLPGLAQRPPERLQHDQRRPGGPLDSAPGRGVPPGRPGRAAGGSRAGGLPDEVPAGGERIMSGQMRERDGPRSERTPGRPRTRPDPGSRFSLNQWTTKRWSVAEAVDGCVRHGVEAIGLWRQDVAEQGLDETVKLVADAGLRVSSLCRGGFLTSGDPEPWTTTAGRSTRPRS